MPSRRSSAGRAPRPERIKVAGALWRGLMIALGVELVCIVLIVGVSRC